MDHTWDIPEKIPEVGSVVELRESLERLEDAVGAVVRHGADTWSRLSAVDRQRLAGQMERSRKKLCLADAAFIDAHEASMSDVPQRRARLISRIFHITLREARTKLAAATRLSARPDPWSADPGAPGPDHMPYLTAAVADGRADCTAVEKVDRQIRALPSAVQAGITRIADEPVAGLVRTQGPDALDSLRGFLLDLVGAEEPYTDADHRRMRSFTVGRQGPDGMTPVRGLLTPEAAATLTRLMIDHAGTGALCGGGGDSGTGSSDGAGTAGVSTTDVSATDDRRTPEQRRHDALLAAVNAGYGPGKPLSTGRGTTTLVAVTDLATLASARGTALTDVGVRVPVSTLVEDPDRVRTCLQLLDIEGRTLFFGRSRRLGNLDQYLALVGEEGLSSAPGSDSSPAASHMHHIDGWTAGGPTDIDNLTFAAPPQHALVDDTRTDPDRWWTLPAPPGSGRRVDWIPPVSVDPDRRPVHNDHPAVWGHPGVARRRLFRQHHGPDAGDRTDSGTRADRTARRSRADLEDSGDRTGTDPP